ncbi:IS66 family transposase zinc-finger binding domain-containing protein [Yoonia sp. BS5-3]|uniref:IS66 family transposase zinc-finger binding domain-containing protein n=1 Tax=Yoonia phaeophyticola TaxID=3137369 RepID=A0ABZ2V5T6_9RHOB
MFDLLGDLKMRCAVWRFRARLNKSRDMQFGQSSEKVKNEKTKDDDGVDSVGIPTDGSKLNSGGAKAQPEANKPKPRGMLGRQAVEIPAHLPRNKFTISPSTGSVCECGCGMALIGEQTIERLTYKPAEVRVIEERYPKYVCRNCDRLVQAPVPNPRESCGRLCG